MILRSEEAIREAEFNEEVNRLIDGGGCWLTAFTGEEQKKIPEGCKGQKPCESCPLYKAFYRTEEYYMGVTKKESEAIWLTCQFYDIKTDYMCDGEREDWLKEYKPEKYAVNLIRQAELMGEKTKEQPKEQTGQMTIEDFLQGVTYG